MRRASRPLLTLATALFLAASLFCSTLAAQRRSVPYPSTFPDTDEGLGSTRPRSFSVNGTVADAESRMAMGGVRVDLQAITGGILATAFTGANGIFQFNNVRSGNYELIFDEPGYEDRREHLDVDGPVFGVIVELRRLNGGGPGSPSGPTVSVRELSIPQKAHDAMGKGMSLLYQKSDNAGSIKQFQRAIQAYPGYYEAYAQMGLAYMRMKDAGHSEQALRKSAELSQEHYPDAFFLLAALFSSAQRFADAEPLARKAVELNPNSWHAQSELAQALLGLKRADDAEKPADAAVKLQPDNPILHLLLADVHIALGNGPALLDDLNTYLKLAPNGSFAEQVRQHRDELQQRLQNSQAAPAGNSSASAPANP